MARIIIKHRGETYKEEKREGVTINMRDLNTTDLIDILIKKGVITLTDLE